MIRTPHRKLVLLVLATFLFVEYPCFAQPQFRFQHYSTADGLGHDYTLSIAKDSLGYIWMQNFGVLSRFDGYNFKVYRYDPADSLRSALGFGLGSLNMDRLGNIWIRPHHPNPDSLFTLTKHDRKTDGFIKYTLGLKSGGIIRMRFEEDGSAIWFGTTSGLYHFDLKTQETQNFLNPHTDSTISERRNRVRGISVRDSSLLLSTNQGLWLFNKRTKTFSRPPVNPKDSTLLYHAGIGNITDYPKYDFDDVWFFVNGGLTKIDSKYHILQRFDLPKDFSINGYDRDKEGIFWFGTDNGVHRYNPKDSSFLNIVAEPQNSHSLQRNLDNDVTVDSDLNIWLGRGALSRMRQPDVPFRNFSFHVGSLGPASLIYKTGDKEYLVLSQFAKREPTARIHDIIMAPVVPGSLDSLRFQKMSFQVSGVEIEKFSQGKKTLWVSAFGKGITGFPIDPITGMPEPSPLKILQHDPNNPNTITNDQTLAVWETPGGTVWVGYNGAGISKINQNVSYGEPNSITKFPFGDKTYSFFPESKNSFWVVQSDRGVYLFQNEALTLVTKTRGNVIFRAGDGTLYLGGAGGLYVSEEGAKYNFNPVPLWNESDISDIQEDNLGRLWLLTDKSSVVCYHPKEKWAIEFGKNDGFEHAGNYMHKAADGTMLIRDADGVTRFDPSQLQISRAKTYPALTNLLVNNQPPDVGTVANRKDAFVIPHDIGVLKELVIDYQHNNFTIEFAAMEIISPQKNLYRHMLVGFDKDWIETDYKNRTATYTNLPAGDYTFRIKASNHHGIWSDQERTLKVVVLPPPWKTAWAYTGYGILLLGVLYAARRNIVQRERLKSNLRLEHVELEKAKEVDRVKTSFFTNISHEFRTPLTLIKGPVQNLLEEFADNPKVRDRLKLVERNSDLLLRLINQLLDLAKLESGSLKVEKTEGELNSFIRAIASSFESFARQKNISIEVDVPANKCTAFFDKDKLETILINLINNAIKFTPAGGSVTVSVDLTPASTASQRAPSPEERGGVFDSSVGADSLSPISNGDAPSPMERVGVRLIVKDTGIGIPEEQQTKIFERFHQVSEAHKEVGTGIGLSLVKELVALMGGEIAVQSEVGKGSEFKVALPIEITSRQTTPSLPTGQAGGQTTPVEIVDSVKGISNVERPMLNDEVVSTKPHVLVVEDNADLRAFIIDSLGTEFHFLEAENGKIGLDVATREIPDLIISDVMMPEMDGITMAGKIKNDKHTNHIPLILLTAKSSEDSKLSGLQSGADDYLTKPFNKNELLLKVRNGVNRQAKLREKLRAELMSTAPRTEVLSADEQFLNDVKEGILKRLSDEQLSVESLAEDIGMSRVQLYRKITGLTGMSVNELIRKLRLQRAAQLLQQKWGPVSQVAYEVGFSNLSYFSKVFKEEFGVLPSDYKEKLHE